MRTECSTRDLNGWWSTDMRICRREREWVVTCKCDLDGQTRESHNHFRRVLFSFINVTNDDMTMPFLHSKVIAESGSCSGPFSSKPEELSSIRRGSREKDGLVVPPHHTTPCTTPLLVVGRSVGRNCGHEMNELVGRSKTLSVPLSLSLPLHFSPSLVRKEDR